MVAGLALAAVPAFLWVTGAVAPPAPVPPTPAAPTVGGPARQATGPAPVRISVGGVVTDAPVTPVGVDAGGAMAVPLDVGTLGWYRFGSAPGDPSGSAVLSGHVDDRRQGRGAFFRLADAAPGAPVEVHLADGSSLTYRIASITRHPKEALPVQRVFARDGPPVLTLITCGGEFDPGERAYRDNVVVTAVPTRR